MRKGNKVEKSGHKKDDYEIASTSVAGIEVKLVESLIASVRN